MASENVTEARPWKFDNGEWGARIVVTGRVNSGDTITIRTKSGKSWNATIDEICNVMEYAYFDVLIVSLMKEPQIDQEDVLDDDDLLVDDP